MKNKNLIIGIFVGALIVGIVWFINSQTLNNVGSVTSKSAIGYNCELSGGQITNGQCVCPIEENLGQTQDEMYDQSTGFCQTTAGGPGGDAFYSSIGLPYGDYSFFNTIVGYQCTQSGGEFFNSRCDCGSKIYDKKTGLCK